MNKNSITLGILIATILPIIIFAVAFVIRFNDIGYMTVLKSALYQQVIPKMLSLCVYPNGLVFIYFIRSNQLSTMRGMLVGTVIMALLVLMLYLRLA